MSKDQYPNPVNDPVAILERWEAAGGTWRVLVQRDDAITISLCQCDGDAEADRFTSTSPELARYLAGRTRNDVAP